MYCVLSRSDRAASVPRSAAPPPAHPRGTGPTPGAGPLRSHPRKAALAACAVAIPAHAAVALARLEGAILRRVPTRTVASRYVSCPLGPGRVGPQGDADNPVHVDGHGNPPPRGTLPRAVGLAISLDRLPGTAHLAENLVEPCAVWADTAQHTGRKVIQVTRTEQSRMTPPTDPDAVAIIETGRRPIIDCTHPWPEAWPIPTTTIEETLEWRTVPCPTAHPLAVPAGSPQRQRRVIRLATEAAQASGTCAAGHTGTTTLERTRPYVARVYALPIAQGQRTGIPEDRKPGLAGPWGAWTTVSSSCTPIPTSTGGGGASDLHPDRLRHAGGDPGRHRCWCRPRTATRRIPLPPPPCGRPCRAHRGCVPAP